MALKERPTESLIGLGILALGLPAYVFWRLEPPQRPRAGAARGFNAPL